MAVFVVQKLRYIQIRSGFSRVEYRPVKPFWDRKVLGLTDFWKDRAPAEGDFVHFGRCEKPAAFRWGPKLETRHNIPVWITDIEVVKGMSTPLKTEGLAYAFKFQVAGPEYSTKPEDEKK